LPYIVYSTPFSTDGAEYPSPSARFQTLRGPLAGQVS
jgi:hypothetical protein